MDVLQQTVDQPPVTIEVRSPAAILSVGAHGPDLIARVADLERQAQPITLICLGGGKHEHEKTAADRIHLPLLSLAILSSVALFVTRDPIRVLRCLRHLRPSSIFHLPAAIHLARLLPGRGIADVQGVGRLASRIASVVRCLSEPAAPDLTELPVDWSRLHAKRIGVRWFSRRINCVAAEVSLDEGERRVIVKRQRHDAMRTAADRAGHEYRVMESLTRKIADATLTVPRVLLVDEPAGILVMERAPGERFDTLFGTVAGDRTRMQELVSGIRGAGAWLAAMQNATLSDRDGRALLSEIVATAVEDVTKMASRDKAIRRRHSEIVRLLHDLEKDLSGRPLAVAGHHGDYWPGNVFFDGERVTVIDFEGFRDGLWLEDVAYFLIRSNMLCHRFRLPFPDLARQFFQGYAPGQQADPRALRLFTLTKGLRTLANGTGDDLPLPQRMWTRRSLRGAVFHAMRDRQ